MRKFEIMRRLVEIADVEGEQIQDLAGKPDDRGACILMTAIGCEVLARFNIKANPFSVHVLSCNAAYVRWVEIGHPKPQPVDACWVDTRWGPTRGGDGNQDGFAGHVMVHLPDDNFLLDLDFRQFARPLRGLHLPNAWPNGSTFETYPFLAGAKVAIWARPEVMPNVGSGTLDVAARFASEIVLKMR